MLTKVEEEGNEHIVSWQPHGRCFLVRDNIKFVENVLPRYFSQKKLASFQRQLNLYGFRRITAGTDKGSYYHECFLRGKEFLIKRISRHKIKGTGARLPGNPDQEPNFYSMLPMPFLEKSKSKSDDSHNDNDKREESTNGKGTTTEDHKISHKEASALDIEPISLNEVSGLVASVATTPPFSNPSNIAKDDCKPSSLQYSETITTNSATRPNKRRNALDLQHSEISSTNSATRSHRENILDQFKSNGTSCASNPSLAGDNNVPCASFLQGYEQQQYHQQPTSYQGMPFSNNSSNSGNLSARNMLLSVSSAMPATSQLHRNEQQQQQYQQPTSHKEISFQMSTSQHPDHTNSDYVNASERVLPYYSSQSLHGNNIGNGEIFVQQSHASETIDQQHPENGITFHTSVGHGDASLTPSYALAEHPSHNDTSSSSDNSDEENDSSLDISKQLAFIEEMELIQSLGESNVSEEELGDRLGRLINM